MRAIVDQSTTASTRPSASPLSRTAAIGARLGKVALSLATMPLHMESAALVFVRDDPTFGRGGERSRSANSRVSSDAVSGGNPQRFRDSFREAAPATSATIVQDLHEAKGPGGTNP